MPYPLRNSRGETLVTIPDQIIDTTTTSLSLPGRGAVGYAPLMAENLVALIENFANSIPPRQPQAGQLWFDVGTGRLKVYNGNWNPVAGVTSVTLRGTNGVVVRGSTITADGTYELSLATTGVVPAIYSNPTLTIDSFGRVVSASNGSGSGSITSAQGKIALLYAGLLDPAIAALGAIGNPTERRVKQIKFDAPFWNRSDEMFDFLVHALGITPERMNELFLDARLR